MKNLTIIVFILFVGFILIPKTLACTCYPLPPIYSAFKTSDAVFVGKVISSNEPEDDDRNYNGHDIIFDFDVIENFKGVNGNKVKLNLGTKASSCYGSGYKVGDTYLIYADKEGLALTHKNQPSPEMVFQESYCHRSENIKSAQDQLFFIREILNGNPENQIYGSVARSDTDPVSFQYRNTLLNNIKVVLKDESNTFETRTDKNGLFRFNNIPKGEYVLVPEPTENYRVYYPTQEKVTILEDRTVFSREIAGFPEPYTNFYGEFIFGWNNSIEGNVVDVEDKPFERFVVSFLPFARAHKNLKQDVIKDFPERKREGGKFSFSGETPGNYVIAVEIFAPFGNKIKKRFYYPNAKSVEKAEIFNISETTKIENLQIKLPLTIKKIKGEMVWESGELINDDGWIKLFKDKDPQAKSNIRFGLENVKNGRFTIRVIEGAEYWLHPNISVEIIEKGEDRRLTLKAEPQKINVGKENNPIKIYFKKPKNLIFGKY